MMLPASSGAFASVVMMFMAPCVSCDVTSLHACRCLTRTVFDPHAPVCA